MISMWNAFRRVLPCVVMMLMMTLPAVHTEAKPKSKPMLMWIDAEANFKRLSSPDSIAWYLEKIKSLGFTDIAVEMKTVTGEVLYPSRYAPIMRQWDHFTRPRTFDYLGTFLQEARRRRLRIHAALNMFAEGDIPLVRGVVFAMHPEWATLVYTDTGMVSIIRLNGKTIAMVNPADTAVQNHELNVIGELLAKYPVDGVILDRVRYDDLGADFSPLSKSLFEKRIGARIEHFPADIFEWEKPKGGALRTKPGKFFREWLTWRASVIYEFMAKARERVKRTRPSASFGDNSGAWYPIYFQAGANWASRTFDPSKEYRWARPDYVTTGYAELLNLLTLENNYFDVTKAQLAASHHASITDPKLELWASVEGSIELEKHVVRNVVPVYGGVSVETYRGDADRFTDAVAMNLKNSDGLMIFDIVHIIEMNWWDALKRGIAMGR